MGNKVRALGADITVKAAFESAYGTPPASGSYKGLTIKTWGLDSEIPLEDDPLLGQGRNAQDPTDGAVDVSGAVGIPLDVRGTGFHLKAVFGAPTTTAVKATGTITFDDQPAADSTITLNGTVWTFVASGASGAETNIGGDLEATLTALASDLNGSADAEVAKCTYDSTATELTIEFDTGGTTGNAFTLAALAASNGEVSAATLEGGGWSHAFDSGAAELPSLTWELGHPQLASAKFERYFGAKAGGISFEMTRTGPANATIDYVAQSRLTPDAATTIDAEAETYALARFSQGRCEILAEGVQLAAVTGGRFAFTNGNAPVQTIRADGAIDGVDEGEAKATGEVTVRHGPTSAMTTAVDDRTPVTVRYGFTHPAGWFLRFDMERVFFPKPKKQIQGPGAIEATYAWQAAAGATYNLRATLFNDVASY